jgi:chromosome segregation ATPase
MGARKFIILSAVMITGHALKYSTKSHGINCIVDVFTRYILGAIIGHCIAHYLTPYALGDFAKPDPNPDSDSMSLRWRDAVARENYALQESTAKAQADVREKDRIIQCQREMIESLEHRSAAHVRSIMGQRNLLEIKDSILVNKNRQIKDLKDDLCKSDMRIRDLQWDNESLQANIEWKDETLWVVTGRDSCALETIENLQCNLAGCIKVLTWSDKAETAAVDRLEKKYAPLLEQLESKLKDAELRLHNADELRVVNEKDMQYYIECIKVKDVALRNAEALLKKSEAERKILIDEKANIQSQQLLEKAKHEREFANATRRLGNRHKDYFNLEKQHEEDLEAAFAERKDFEAQISTLNTELSECKGRLATVNTKILDRETQLASALKAKEELESKLKATTERADENALTTGFARNALDSAINQLKALNSECNTHKLARKQFEGAFSASQKSLNESHNMMHLERAQKYRYLDELNAIEKRYNDGVVASASLQKRLNTSSAMISTMQTKLNVANGLTARLEEKLGIQNKLVANLQAQLDTVRNEAADAQSSLKATQTLARDMRALWDNARTRAANLQNKLETSNQLVLESKDRAAALETRANNLEASLAVVQKALANTRSAALEQATIAKQNFDDYAVEISNANSQIAADKAKIDALEAQVGEAQRAAEDMAEQCRQAHKGREQTCKKLRQAVRVMQMMKGRINGLRGELEEESRAREAAEGYVEFEEGDFEDEVVEEEVEVDEEGDDGDDEEDSEEESGEEEEDEEEFEGVEVIEGREPVEGEEGFEFVESE